MAEQKSFSVPPIDVRFLYTVPRKIKEYNKIGGYRYKTILATALTAEGYIDIAHQMGLKDIITETIESNFVVEPDGGTTHWVTVKATVQVNGRTVTGLSTVNSRVVQTAGFETAVAETRAIKRAIANGCAISEKVLNPNHEQATHEVVDLPLPDDHDVSVPDEITKSATAVIPPDGGDQFDI